MFQKLTHLTSQQIRHMTLTSFLTLVCLAAITVTSSAVEASDIRAETMDTVPAEETQQVYLLTGHGAPERAAAADVLLKDGQKVSVSYYDSEQTITAHDESIAALLDRLYMEPSPLDMVGVALSGDPVEIHIGQEIVVYDTEKTVTPSPVTYRYNDTMPTWSEKVIKDGQDGVHTEVYEVIYSGGKEVSRHLIEETTTEATESIVEKGTLENFAENKTKVTEIIDNGNGTGTLVLENGEKVTYKEKRTMKATAYTTGDPGVGTITATGTTVRRGTVGVNPRGIPYGTKMYIVTSDGSYVYGFSRAEDTGAIGTNRIDLYHYTYNDCIQFGVRNCDVYILD